MTYIFLFLLGSAIGSFLNVLTDRWSTGESIMGRSACDHCHKKIQWYDLLPVVSYFILGGKSRCCHKKISFYYPLIEFLTGAAFVLGWIYFPGTDIFLAKIIFLVILCALIVVFFADTKYQIIPDEVQVIFLLSSLIFLFSQKIPLSSFLQHILAAFLLMLSILSLFLLTKGRGMGFGDVKLAFSIGLLLGVKNGFLSLYFAFILGALIGILAILFKKKKFKSKIAFGPFLISGLLLVFFWQEKIDILLKKLYGL